MNILTPFMYDPPHALGDPTTAILISAQHLRLLGFGGKEQKYFSTLSYGEQRLALIARAVVKLPLILILDEPCQGLDNINRARVLGTSPKISYHYVQFNLLILHYKKF